MSEFWDDAATPEKASPLGPIFVAEYETESACCGDVISPGEDARADGHGGWIHADTSCEAIVLGTDLDASTGPVAFMSPIQSDSRAAGRLCPSCYCFHAGECA